MYERFYQLRERPFALSPDPEYLYPSRVHQEALDYLRYGLESQAGFIVITGEIGSGKTTLLQTLLRNLDNQTSVGRIVNTMLEPRELLEAILLDFGLDPTGLSKPVLLHRLADFLVQQRQAGRLTLLVIDEAQNLSLPALEEIRMLSNLETEKSKLVQIIMVGQPELREKLRLPQLEQLRQRITVSYHLQPLDAEETVRYINHRLKRAAVGAPLEFPRDVTDLIHRRSRGVPRIINVIADATLLFAYGLDRQGVDLATAQEALGELDTTGVLASYQSEGSLAAGSAPLSIVDAQDAMQFTDAVRQLERNLSERERDLRDREQALTAQQRVLEEQARLLAATRSAAALAATPAAGPATTPVTEPVSAATAPQPEVRPAPTASASSAFSQPAVPVAPAVRVVPSTAARTSAPSQQTSTTRSAHPATPPAGRTVAGGGQSGSSVARPVFRPGSPDATGTNRIFVPTQVQVQPYRPPVRIQQHSGLWSRLRRVLFGVTEPEAGA
jgi:putative secretion ATPase (PEP-CTERM system associated)